MGHGWGRHLWRCRLPDRAGGHQGQQPQGATTRRPNKATELANRVHALTPQALGRRQNLKLIREYADAALERDALDDVIADTNALLNRASTWPTALDRQLAPFRNDLAGLEQLLTKRHGQGDSATAAALRSFRD